MTHRQFRAKSYLFLMRKAYYRMMDRWFVACVRGGAVGPLSLQVMGIRDPANYEVDAPQSAPSHP
jgi:hypothetical protein